MAPRSWARPGRGPVRQPDGAPGPRHLLAAFTNGSTCVPRCSHLRAQVQPAADLIRSATTTAARLLREEGRVGTLAVGAQAYCWSRGGSPLEDIPVLTKPREHLRHVIKAGTPM